MPSIQMISPCLWFDTQAEEAARYYVGIFPNSRIGQITRYTEAGKEIHGREAGSVLTVAFELNGQPFTGLNGGPMFKFNEAISFQVHCQSQQEIDDFWNKLSDAGDPSAQQCGWLKDKFGVSWQIVPAVLAEMMADPDVSKIGRMMDALMQMKKLEIEPLQRAFRGK